MADKPKSASNTINNPSAPSPNAKKPEASRPADSGARTAARAAGEIKPPQVVKISAGDRARMIAEAAYFLALNRGFDSGDNVQDWLTAEAQVDAQLRTRG